MLGYEYFSCAYSALIAICSTSIAINIHSLLLILCISFDAFFNVTLRAYINTEVYTDVLFYVNEVADILEDVYGELVDNPSQPPEPPSARSRRGFLLLEEEEEESQSRYGDPVRVLMYGMLLMLMPILVS